MPSLLAGMRGRRRARARSCTGCSSAWTSPRPTSTRSSPRAGVDDAAAARRGCGPRLETPLGPLVDELRLADVARADRLDELAFELPLAGADTPHGEVELAAVADVLRRHGGALAPLRRAARRSRAAQAGAGLPDRQHRSGRSACPAARFAIADYKTNWLAAPGEELTAWHYRPAALAAEMEHAHYGLQALLYTVALHRYLRWRLPDHDPERDIAGVLYLFVRGHAGAGHAGARRGALRRLRLAAGAALVVGALAVLDRGAPA